MVGSKCRRAARATSARGLGTDGAVPATRRRKPARLRERLVHMAPVWLLCRRSGWRAGSSCTTSGRRYEGARSTATHRARSRACRSVNSGRRGNLWPRAVEIRTALVSSTCRCMIGLRLTSHLLALHAGDAYFSALFGAFDAAVAVVRAALLTVVRAAPGRAGRRARGVTRLRCACIRA